MTSPRPHPDSPELQGALEAVETAYSRVSAVPHPDQRLLHELQRYARELGAAADRSLPEGRHAGSRHVRRRCVAAHRGAEWILAHYR
ncbi:hypothetical protein [Yinghuangia seranimata]|uniref:hypothetical protein n=1 Tax=Yinghuangia seranimata TaxID=408067 RepID=UPI00248B2BC3|nr:hypothetical protein [Yinghuangia seranimata]MDI2124995.1 hypothetical protein [Yinghuangia seranimata]